MRSTIGTRLSKRAQRLEILFDHSINFKLKKIDKWRAFYLDPKIPKWFKNIKAEFLVQERTDLDSIYKFYILYNIQETPKGNSFSLLEYHIINSSLFLNNSTSLWHQGEDISKKILK